MADLLFLTGAPGSGKSTLARRYVDDRPLSLLLDIDTIRAHLGAWREDPGAAGLAARQLAREMARVHLVSGHDVVVPQFVARPDLIDQLREVAAETGSRFLLAVLVSSPEEAASRFAARGSSDDPNHRDAADLQRSVWTTPVEESYRAMLAMLEAYDDVRHVTSVPGDVDGTYAELVRLLAD
ncbi:MAG TPA: ATP-binding protein [Propionibacteriaceae bacterium]|nr:ATP-binding protein [Propionibacteriaceae bacterium]